MGSSTVLIGSIVVAITSCWLFISLMRKDNSKGRSDDDLNPRNDNPDTNNNPFVIFFALICIAIFFFSINLIATLGYESYNYCSVMPTNSSLVGGLTVYNYDNVCVINTGKSADGLVDLVNFWNVATLTLFGGFILFFLYQWVKGRYDQYKKP